MKSEYMRTKLDEKDRKIIKELEQNARLPVAQIAKKVGLSTELTNYRLKKLLDSGIIRRNYAVIDFPRIGYTIYRILFQLEDVSQKTEENMLDYFKKLPNTLWAGSCSGEWDIIATIIAKDVSEFHYIVTTILEKFGTHIRNKDITITHLQTSEPPAYLLSKELRIGREKVVTTPANLDEVDYRILRILYEDARTPSIEIARKAGISSDTVQYRIKKLLQDNIIRRFRCWLDRRPLGYQHYKVLLRLQHATIERRDDLTKFCENNPNIIFFASIIGSWDMELDIDARDNTEFHNIMRDLRNKFTDIIRNYESVIIFHDFLSTPEFKP